MTLRRSSRGRLIEALDDMASGFDSFYVNPFESFHTFGGQIYVDTSKYDIVPKPEHQETLITQKQEQIEALERQHKNEELYYQEKLKTLKQEKETLLRDRDNRK